MLVISAIIFSLLIYYCFSWRVLRVQKCEQDVKTKDVPLKEVQPEEESTSVVQDKPKLQSSCLIESGDEESDSDIDLDELAQALEQASTLASHSKKQEGTKHTKKIVKSPVGKKMIVDSTTPGYTLFFLSCWIFLFIFSFCIIYCLPMPIGSNFFGTLP